MAIIRHKYEGQLDELIKDLRRLGLRVYFNIKNALVSLSEEKERLLEKPLRKIRKLIN